MSLVDDRFSGLKHFWSATVVKRPKNIKKLKENIELYKPEGNFSSEEMIENLVSLTGVFPMSLVLSESVLEQLNEYYVPPLGEWDNDLGVAWFVPREIIEKKTKNGNSYWILRVVDDTSTINSIKCWGVNSKKDKIYLNQPYMAKLDYDSNWGFSTRSIKHNFRVLK